MITALLVVLFAAVTVIIGWLAHSRGWDTGYDLGFDSGAASLNEDMDRLYDRIEGLNDLLAATVTQSDSWKRQLQLAQFTEALLWVNLHNAELEKETAIKLLGRCIQYDQAISDWADKVYAYCQNMSKWALTTEQRLQDDADHIDGLTVDLAMAEHERDEAKATIEKILLLKMPIKVATQLSRIATTK